MLNKLFKLEENHTNVKTEVLAGITTFMTMAYILAVNPTMLSAAGMDATAVLIATCLAAFVGTLAMALLANYPFALAPGMGLNAYFAYTVCGNMGYDWRVALMAVFIEGIIFVVLSLTNVREAIFNAIPSTLKKGVSAGIGLFIAFIGLQGAHIVVANSSTLVSYVNFTENWDQRINPDRNHCDMGAWHDLSGSGNLSGRCRKRILFAVSGTWNDRFHCDWKDIWTVLCRRF